MPFTLTHPKPEPINETDSKSDIKLENTTENTTDQKKSTNNGTDDDTTGPVDHNLIEFDTRFVYFSSIIIFIKIENLFYNFTLVLTISLVVVVAMMI